VNISRIIDIMFYEKISLYISRIFRFNILPVGVLGRDATMITFLGTLNAARCSLHKLMISTSVMVSPFRGTTIAATASTHLYNNVLLPETTKAEGNQSFCLSCLWY
jgi:hypothetical protein